MSKSNDFIIFMVIFSFMIALFGPVIYDTSQIISRETIDAAELRPTELRVVDNWNLFGFGKNSHYLFHVDPIGAYYNQWWEKIDETSTPDWESDFPIEISIVIVLMWMTALGCSFVFYFVPALKKEKMITLKHTFFSIGTTVSFIIAFIGLVFWSYEANRLISNTSVQDTNGNYIDVSNHVETGLAFSFLLWMNFFALVVSMFNTFNIIKQGVKEDLDGFSVFKERKSDFMLTIISLLTLGLAFLQISFLAMVNKKNTLYEFRYLSDDDVNHIALNNGNLLGNGYTNFNIETCGPLGCSIRPVTTDKWTTIIADQFPQGLAYLIVVGWIILLVVQIYTLYLKQAQSQKIITKIKIAHYFSVVLIVLTTIATIAWGIIISDISHEVSYRNELHQIKLGVGIGFYLVLILLTISLVLTSNNILSQQKVKISKDEKELDAVEEERIKLIEEMRDKSIERYPLTNAQRAGMVVAIGLILISTYDYFFSYVFNFDISYVRYQLIIGFAGGVILFKAFDSSPVSIEFKQLLVFAAGYNGILAMSIVSRTSAYGVLLIYSMAMIAHLVAFFIFFFKIE